MQPAAGWFCYRLWSEMWSDLCEILCAAAFGVWYSQTVWSGEEFERLLPLHGVGFPHSWEQCYFFTQMVFVSCLQGPPWGFVQEWLRRCQRRGRLAERPLLPLLSAALPRFPPGAEAALCSLLEIKGDTAMAGEKAGGDS